MNQTNWTNNKLTLGDIAAELNLLYAENQTTAPRTWAIFPLVLIICWTLGSNGTVIYALFRKPALRITSNLLVGHLALTDFLIGLLCMTVSAIKDVLGLWPFSTVFCVAWLDGNRLIYTASVWSTTSIAIDRYLAIAYPRWYLFGVKRKVQRTLTYYILIWIISLGISGPSLLMTSQKMRLLQKFDNQTSHPMYSEIEPFYAIYVVSGSFLLPLILMISLYARMLVLMRRQRVDLAKRFNLQDRFRMNLLNLNSAPGSPFRDGSSNTNVFVNPIQSEPMQSSKRTHTTVHPYNESNNLLNTVHKHTRLKFTCSKQNRVANNQQPWFTVNSEVQNTESHFAGVPARLIDMNEPSTLDHRMQREQRATRLVIFLITLLALAWIPHTIAYLSAAFKTPLSNVNGKSSMLLRRILVWNGYVNSALNPIAYVLFNRGMRQVLLPCTWPCERALSG